MLFALVITLYTSRVILNTLGIQDYGIYNVVAGFVSLFAFLNATLSSSMQRFYNFQIGSVGDNGILYYRFMDTCFIGCHYYTNTGDIWGVVCK